MSVEFKGKHSVITPEGVFILGTYDENGVPNAMNAAWGMQSDEGEITLMLSKHKTTENFEKTGAFTVAFGTADTDAHLYLCRKEKRHDPRYDSPLF